MITKVITIEEYLKELSNCDEDDLDEKFDFSRKDWSILLKGEFHKIVRLLQFSKDLSYISKFKDPLFYSPRYRKAIHIRAIPNIPLGSTTGEILFGDISNEHSKYQMENFNMVLQFYQDASSMHKYENPLAMHSKSVKSLVNILDSNDISFCIPYKPIVYSSNLEEIPREIESDIQHVY